MAVERIQFLKVPIDILQPEDLEATLLELANKGIPQQIILLSLWDLLKARRKGEFRSMVTKAALVLPVSKSIIRGVRFLRKKTPVRYNPFSFIISILSVLDEYRRSVYFFGARQRSLLQAERNVHSTFPRTSIVGRFTGYYHKSMEKKIMTAIVKAHPTLTIIGDGVPGGQKWIHRNRGKLHNGIFLWNRDVIDIFSERKRRVSDATFEKGFEYLPEIVKNPLRIFRIFQYLWYNILLVVYRLFRPDA